MTIWCLIVTVELAYLKYPRRKPDAGRRAVVAAIYKDLSTAKLFLNHRIPLLRNNIRKKLFSTSRGTLFEQMKYVGASV